jgi:hypothetical protein
MLHTHICYLSCCCSISIYFVILPTHSHFAHSVCVAMVKHGWAAVLFFLTRAMFSFQFFFEKVL